jgi:hypothetical protein
VQQRSDTPEPTWSLGPFSIKRTTDFLALVAFILSIIGLLAQLRDYWRGAEPVLFAPEQLTLGSSKALKVADFQEQFLVATAILSYVNQAPVGFNAAVSREYIRLQIGDKKYQYMGHDIVKTGSVSGKLDITKKDDAGPFALGAGSAVSHEILFEPHPVKCRGDDQDCVGSLQALKWREFKAIVNKNPSITVTLLADIFRKGTVSVRCIITLDRHDLEAFENEVREWSSPNCSEEPEKTFWKKLRDSIAQLPLSNAYYWY